MITLENIEKTYPARGGSAPVTALADTSLTIDRGEIFGIIGRSGAGKSTLLRTINLLEMPTRGRILVDGVEMTALKPAELRAARHAIGMIFQHFNLLSSRTVFGNVALPLELVGMPKAAIRQAVEPLLDLVGLADKRDRYPAELSGGQKQRVGIARALASKPKVLLSDEATSALDPETTEQILHLLADINRRLGLTIVLITHEIAVIKEICHKVAVLDGGRVIETGPVFDVFAHPRTAVTRSFVDPVINRGLPDSLKGRLAPQPAADRNPVLRITFTGERATSPVISLLSRQFGIDLNIWHGQIDEIQGAPFGTLVVEASGAPAAIEGAIGFLTMNNLGVEVLGHALPANHRVAV
ncbi:methionine ABC transporter ATP-binding protein [Azospirillum sp. ST 5-10]|uniref:methionine ABC transporter ATP-binding protein n=1 Tax=unclassified Azospirillum TaxID=2630922 RepID=UPI003F4A841B